MAGEEVNKNQEAEIFTIPEEFFGAQKRAVPHVVTAVPVKGSAPVAAVPSSVTSKLPMVKKTSNIFSSPKFIITAVVVFLVVVVGGFSYYYIHQAQVAREKLLEAQKKKEQPVVIPQPSQLVTPETTTTPEITPEATSTATLVIPPVSFAVFPFKNYSKSEDIDNDSLTNVEEALYGTKVDKPDTDEDGFPDGLELENLYNPLGFKPVRLIDSGKVKDYSNPTYNYSIFYPALWVAQALDANNEQVIFSSDTGEFVEVTVEDNPLKLSVSDWYLGQSPGVTADQLKTFKTKDNLSGIFSPDGLAAYIPFEDKIFIIYYNIGLKTEVNFLITFKMMVNSFKVGAVNITTPEQIFSTTTTEMTTTTPTSTSL